MLVCSTVDLHGGMCSFLSYICTRTLNLCMDATIILGYCCIQQIFVGHEFQNAPSFRFLNLFSQIPCMSEDFPDNSFCAQGASTWRTETSLHELELFIKHVRSTEGQLARCFDLGGLRWSQKLWNAL